LTVNAIKGKLAFLISKEVVLDLMGLVFHLKGAFCRCAQWALNQSKNERILPLCGYDPVEVLS
jgi:hypothetical protein